MVENNMHYLPCSPICKNKPTTYYIELSAHAFTVTHCHHVLLILVFHRDSKTYYNCNLYYVYIFMFLIPIKYNKSSKFVEFCIHLKQPKFYNKSFNLFNNILNVLFQF